MKNQPYTFKFRSKDVIHCPWFPHFRAQINAVPGMETIFALTPTITTAEMRANPDVIKHWENINVVHVDIDPYNINENGLLAFKWKLTQAQQY